MAQDTDLIGVDIQEIDFQSGESLVVPIHTHRNMRDVAQV